MYICVVFINEHICVIHNNWVYILAFNKAIVRPHIRITKIELTIVTLLAHVTTVDFYICDYYKQPNGSFVPSRNV